MTESFFLLGEGLGSRSAQKSTEHGQQHRDTSSDVALGHTLCMCYISVMSTTLLPLSLSLRAFPLLSGRSEEV